MSADADFLNECLVFSAPDRARLLARLAEWEARAAAPAPGVRLLDFAAGAAAEYARAGATLALTASSFDELHKKLAHARERLAKPETRRIQDKSGVYFYEEKLALDSRLVFVFPGEGAQYPNMLRGLCLRYPEARAPFDEFDAACAGAADGYRPSEVMFPPPGAADAEEALFEMKGAVQAVTCANMAIYRLLRRAGLRPDVLVGHSSGEFMALEAGGMVCFDERAARIRFIREGYELMMRMAARADIREGVLLTVGGVEREEAAALLARHPDDLMLAMDNCPHQFVLCGTRVRIEAVMEELTEQGAICTQLPFTRPYHTPWFAPALDGIDRYLGAQGLRAPAIETWSCMTVAPFPSDPAEIRRIAVQQWAAPVRFRETIEALFARGARVFVDAGPRGNMTAFIDDILRDEPHLTITANRAHRSDILQFNQALAQLAAHGAALDWASWFAGRGARPIEAASRLSARALTLASDPPAMRAVGYTPRPRAALVATPSVGAPGAGLAPAPETQAAPMNERDAVMAAYIETMEMFLASQRELIGTMFGGSPALSSAGTPATGVASAPLSFPLLGSIIEHDSERRLVARRTFDLNEDVFLRDHTLGVEVSKEDPELPGLSIMPLTMSLALAAEAAQALMPGLRVVGMKDVQANRWISLEDDRITVLAVAQRIGDSREVRVEIREDSAGDPRAAFRPPYVQATVLMDTDYAPAPPMPTVSLKHEKPSGWTGRELYCDRLFHLGRFQCVQSVHHWAEEGMLGTIRVLPRNQLFASNPDPRFTVDGVLLDAVGAMLGLWGSYEKWDGTVYLPFRVRRIDFFGPPLPVGTTLEVALAVRSQEPGSACCDTFAATPDGRLHIRLTEWEDRVWNISPGLHRFLLRGFDKYISEPLALPPALVSALKQPLILRITRGISYETLEGSHRVWQKVLAFLAHDREGRAEFKAMRGTERRRSEWAVGRATLKEAVRCLLQATAGEAPPAADIPIRTDARGRPLAMGAWRTRHPALRPHISLAHGGGTALAAACEGAEWIGIGVDIEPIRAPSPDLVEGAFAAEDRTHDEETFWRRWCAKEAVVKALGTGLLYDARDLRIAAENPAAGRVDIRLAGAWRDALPAYNEKILSAYTFRDNNEIIAVCVL